MDRRLKLYREHNIHESGNSVQDFFLRYIPKSSAKLLPFDKEPAHQMQELQQFIERQGKPCCLNLITEADTKFMKKMEK